MTAISLWHAIGGAYPERPPLTQSVDADLTIIGGGFAGLSTALHAAEKGLSVIAALGIERGERLIRFASSSADLVFNLIRRHGIACQAERSGWTQPAHSASAFAKVKSRAAQWASRGRPAEVMDSAKTERVTGAQGYAGSWMDCSGGVLDPVAYARGLAGAAETAAPASSNEARSPQSHLPTAATP